MLAGVGMTKLLGATAEAVSAEFTPLFGDGGRPLCAGCVLNWTGAATAEQLAAPARLRASLVGAGETVAVLGAGSILGTTKPAVLQLCVGAVLRGRSDDTADTADDDEDATLTPTTSSASDAELAMSFVALRLRSASRRTRSVPLPLASLPWWSPVEARAAATVERAEATAAWQAHDATDAVHPLSVCERFGYVGVDIGVCSSCPPPHGPCGIVSCRGSFRPRPSLLTARIQLRLRLTRMFVGLTGDARQTFSAWRSRTCLSCSRLASSVELTNERGNAGWGEQWVRRDSQDGAPMRLIQVPIEWFTREASGNPAELTVGGQRSTTALPFVPDAAAGVGVDEGWDTAVLEGLGDVGVRVVVGDLYAAAVSSTAQLELEWAGGQHPPVSTMRVASPFISRAPNTTVSATPH